MIIVESEVSIEYSQSMGKKVPRSTYNLHADDFKFHISNSDLSPAVGTY